MTSDQETLLLRHLPLTTEPLADPGELFTCVGNLFGRVAAFRTTTEEDALLADAVAEIVNAWPVQREMLRIAVSAIVGFGETTEEALLRKLEIMARHALDRTVPT